jgi:hypothetical protein
MHSYLHILYYFFRKELLISDENGLKVEDVNIS